MPNYFAHRQFGARVLAALPPALAAVLERERDAFDLGLYGPDPLFFYRPILHSEPFVLGTSMHHQPVRPVAERLRRAVEENRPFARGYSADFLCHFALDCRCHAYINERSGHGVTHSGMESELDRALMLQAGIDPLHTTPLPQPELPQAAYETIVQAAYPGVTPAQYQKGFAGFRRISRLLTRASGTRLRQVVNAVSRIPLCSFFREAVLTRSPNPAYAADTAVLLDLLEREVAPTAQAVAGFFAAIAKGTPLSSAWYDRDFEGNSFPAQPASRAAGGPAL